MNTKEAAPTQIKCKNCGADITEFSPYSTTIECPYCHENILNPLAISRIQEDHPEKYIPFRASEDFFSEFLIKQLIEGNYIPTDIFRKMVCGTPVQIYVPAYYFNGAYYCNWNCEVGISRQVREGNSTKTVTEWHPENGMYAGSYKILQPAFSIEGTESNKALLTLTEKTINAERYTIEPFDPAYFDNLPKNVTQLDKYGDDNDAWYNAQSYLQEISHYAVKNQLRSKNTRSLRTELVAAQPDSSLTLMPFFLVDYTYKGNTYSCSLDGYDDTHFSLYSPEDKGISSQIHSITYLLIAVILGIIGACFYMYNYMPEINQDYLIWGGLGSVAVSAIIYFIRYRQIIGKYRKMRIIEASQLFPESEIVKQKLAEL